MTPANYMDSIISCLLKLERKRSKFVVTGEVPAASRTLPESKAMFNSLWFHIYTIIYKEFQSMDYSSIYDFNKSITTLAQQNCHSYYIAMLQSYLSILQSQYF